MNTKSKQQIVMENNFPPVEARIVMPRVINLIYQPAEGKEQQYSSLRHCLRSLEMLKVWGKGKNPYAIWFAYEAEQRIEEINARMEEISGDAEELRQKECARSGLILHWIEPKQKPSPLKITVTSAQAHFLARLIVRYDECERRTVTLEHVGVACVQPISARLHNEANNLSDLFHKLIQRRKLILKHGWKSSLLI